MNGKCVFGKTRIDFELESFATSSEATLGVSSCVACMSEESVMSGR